MSISLHQLHWSEEEEAEAAMNQVARVPTPATENGDVSTGDVKTWDGVKTGCVNPAFAHGEPLPPHFSLSTTPTPTSQWGYVNGVVY